VLEEVGYYDPMVPETDARTVLKGERIDYWIGVGAQPSDKVAVLIKKYGTNGTHLEEQKAAVERLAGKRRRPSVPTDLPKMEKVARKKKEDKKAETPIAAAVAPAEPETAPAEVGQADVAPPETVPTETVSAEAVPTEAVPTGVAEETT
jgi:small subunit ribosomal protein S16